MNLRRYRVGIVGLGVTGAAIAHELTTGTDVEDVVAFETYDRPGRVNSNKDNNAQTGHGGDLETNIDLERALHQKEAEQSLAEYLETHPGIGEVMQRMVLAVGKKEIRRLEERFNDPRFRALFPNVKRLEANEIADVEPMVMRGRPKRQKVLALYRKIGWTVDYEKLAQSFVDEAKMTGRLDTFFNMKVEDVEKTEEGYILHTNRGAFLVKFLVVAAGPHSLDFAQKLGHAKDLAIFSVGAHFYTSPSVVLGKVYAPQNPVTPWAELHVDKMLHGDSEYSRWGPTVEWRHYDTWHHFFRSPLVGLRGMRAVMKIAAHLKISFFMARNMLYRIPLGKWLLLKRAQRLIPTIRYRDLTLKKGAGGIRPQIVNLKTGELTHGEETIKGENAVFITTPSPGASNCRQNARHIVGEIASALKLRRKKAPLT